MENPLSNIYVRCKNSIRSIIHSPVLFQKQVTGYQNITPVCMCSWVQRMSVFPREFLWWICNLTACAQHSLVQQCSSCYHMWKLWSYWSAVVNCIVSLLYFRRLQRVGDLSEADVFVVGCMWGKTNTAHKCMLRQATSAAIVAGTLSHNALHTCTTYVCMYVHIVWYSQRVIFPLGW